MMKFPMIVFVILAALLLFTYSLNSKEIEIDRKPGIQKSTESAVVFIYQTADVREGSVSGSNYRNRGQGGK